MNILRMNIVQQSNGKYALWNEDDKEFVYQNFDSPELLKAWVLDKADAVLTESIISYAHDDAYFKLCVERYKIENGLSREPQEEAAATLVEMGESVPDF